MRSLTLGMLVLGTAVSAAAFTSAPAAAQGMMSPQYQMIDENGPVRQNGLCRQLAQPGQTNGIYVWVACKTPEKRVRVPRAKG